MKLLLDTHALIWWHDSPDQLSKSALDAIKDPVSEIFVSVASAWEMQIKVQLGKLTLSKDIQQIIEQEQRVNGFGILPVTIDHVYALGSLPAHHKDPFDRLLIAQATHESLTLISRDPHFTSYGISPLW